MEVGLYLLDIPLGRTVVLALGRLAGRAEQQGRQLAGFTRARESQLSGWRGRRWWRGRPQPLIPEYGPQHPPAGAWRRINRPLLPPRIIFPLLTTWPELQCQLALFISYYSFSRIMCVWYCLLFGFAARCNMSLKLGTFWGITSKRWIGLSTEGDY